LPVFGSCAFSECGIVKMQTSEINSWRDRFFMMMGYGVTFVDFVRAFF
jgi:hypothetical protein